MLLPTRLVLLLCLTLLILAAGVYAIVYMRKKLFGSGDDEYSEEDDSILTTAQVESLKAQGLITEDAYQKLKIEAMEAAKRRAEAARSKRIKKSGLLD